MSSRDERRHQYHQQVAERAALAQLQALENSGKSPTSTLYNYEPFDEKQKESLLLSLSSLLTSTTADGSLISLLTSSSSLLGTLEYALHQTYLQLATQRGRIVDDHPLDKQHTTELDRLAATIQYRSYEGCDHVSRFYSCRFTLGLFGDMVTFSLHRDERGGSWCYVSHPEWKREIDLDSADYNEWYLLATTLRLTQTPLQQLANYLAKLTENEFGVPAARWCVPTPTSPT